MSDAGQYSGVGTDSLIVSNLTLSNNNQLFRCIAKYKSCSDTSDAVKLEVLKSLSVAERSNENVLVYPNPVMDRLHIDIDEAKSLEYELYQSDGSLVNHSIVESSNNTIDFQNLSRGIYYLFLKGEYIQVYKLIHY